MISKTSLTDLSDQTLGEWLATLSDGFDQQAAAAISESLQIANSIEAIKPVMPRGVDVAAILKTLNVDPVTIIAAILSDARVTVDGDIEQRFGREVAVLVDSVRRLNSFKEYSPELLDIPGQAETLRRMLLAMVDDVRAVTIKIAYRIQRLRNIASEGCEVRKHIARETLDIYSPLANRLGLAQLKWELEDLAFRYLQPQIYKQIAKSLAENRRYREDYIEQFMAQLNAALAQEHIQAEVSGRPKHIYSIWRKMQRKQVDINKLYDIRAIRVITDSVASCYQVLSLAHSLWHYIPEEFDDYIANPKDNGYQSLHTVVTGAEEAAVEIQIRTAAMHEFAELGVAAHWRYKEGGQYDAAVEKSILYVRALLDSNSGDDENALPEFHAEMYADRIFVLTPRGQIKDLVKGATPLDFAYSIHTEVGHRCRGAKVDGRIVPLTYQLKSGERVEILTTKEGSPKQSWLDPQQGYLKSSHAIGKVRAWFKQQHHEKNLQDGKAILEQERQRLELETIDLGELTRHFHLNRQEDVLIKLGRGDISPLQLAGALKVAPKEEPLALKKESVNKTEESADVSVQGVGNILTHFARCCKPVPGDPIVGYITQTKGISIHRQQCQNILCLSAELQRRLINVSWGDESQVFPSRIVVQAFDRPGLLGDITQIFNHAKADILEVNSRIDPEGLSVTMVITIAIRDTSHLNGILEKISQLNNVLEARRN